MPVHVLLLHVGDERYALPSASVVEVVPSVPLRAVPRVHDGIAGLLAYRGHVVPVVDLCRLFGRGPCPQRLSSRIAVCDRGGALRPIGESVASDREQARRLLGVLAERVTHVGVLDPNAPGSHAGPAVPSLPALGRVTRDAQGLVQLVRLEDLVPADVLALLEREAEPAGGAS